jgi:hypothetical protein
MNRLRKRKRLEDTMGAGEFVAGVEDGDEH